MDILPPCLSVHYRCAVLKVARKGHQISQDRSHCKSRVSAGATARAVTAGCSAHACSSTFPACDGRFCYGVFLLFLSCHLLSHLLVRNMRYRHREPLT